MMMVGTDFLARDYSEYELRILYNICRQSRWCPKHINQLHLLNGIPTHNKGDAKKALQDLLKINLLQHYPSGGRDDCCIPKKNRDDAIKILRRYEKQYSFIKFLEYIS
jgi:hypothetical protein